MKLICVAGAYRAPTIYEIARNIELASAVALQLWKCGAAVICPHKNTAFFDGITSDENFLAGTMLMMEKCDAVVVLPGWQSSKGTMAEAHRAYDLRIPVFMWEFESQQAEIWKYIQGE